MVEEIKKGEEARRDKELVEAFKAGSEAAFDELISRYASKMYQTAYGLIGNKQDAEEVVQDSLIRIHRHLSQFRGDSSFSTWVYRIVVNLSRNKYQWNRRRGSESTISLVEMAKDDEQQNVEYTMPDTKLGPDRIYEGSESEQKIMDALNSLPEKLREVMILRHIEDLSYEEIADMLGCNLGTVKSRISRARESVMEILRPGSTKKE